MKKDDKREYLGSVGDIVKVVGIIQHIGKIREFQSICLASMKVVKKDGSVEKCDHCWIQNYSNELVNHEDIGKILRIEAEVNEYIKYNNSYGGVVKRMGLNLKKIL